jgi:hypothetical protein
MLDGEGGATSALRGERDREVPDVPQAEPVNESDSVTARGLQHRIRTANQREIGATHSGRSASGPLDRVN